MARNAQTIIDEVHARNHIWDAIDQGRLAYHQGVAIDQNPWVTAGLGYHINQSYWREGWNAERAAAVGFPMTYDNDGSAALAATIRGGAAVMSEYFDGAA